MFHCTEAGSDSPLQRLTPGVDRLCTREHQHTLAGDWLESR